MSYLSIKKKDAPVLYFISFTRVSGGRSPETSGCDATPP